MNAAQIVEGGCAFVENVPIARTAEGQGEGQLRPGDRRFLNVPCSHHEASGVGADADLSHILIGDCAMANELREPSSSNFGAFQPAHRKPGAGLKSAPASTLFATSDKPAIELHRREGAWILVPCLRL